MQWACAASDTRVKRRLVAWKPESSDLTSELAQKLASTQQQLDERVDYQRVQAGVQNTPEWHALQAVNNDIYAHNQRLAPKQRKGRKRLVTAERLFKKEKLTRDHKKGGLDFVFYAFEIYEKQLFPFYYEVRALNHDKQVFILEDNVGVYHKARRLLAHTIQQQNIQFLDTPAWSPDLQPIEHLHKDEKQLLTDFRLSVVGADRVIQETVEDEMRHIWINDTRFDDLVRKRCAVAYVQALCYRSKHADPAYSNRYKDSI
jgi:hypothetical protein